MLCQPLQEQHNRNVTGTWPEHSRNMTGAPQEECSNISKSLKFVANKYDRNMTGTVQAKHCKTNMSCLPFQKTLLEYGRNKTWTLRTQYRRHLAIRNATTTKKTSHSACLVAATSQQPTAENHQPTTTNQKPITNSQEKGAGRKSKEKMDRTWQQIMLCQQYQ